jgi:hypothetical protein
MAAPLTAPRATEPPEGTVTLAGVRTAVALLARRGAPEVPRGDVLGGQDPADVLAAMECLAGALLEGVWPDDRGADVLARIGLAVAEVTAGGRG